MWKMTRRGTNYYGAVTEHFMHTTDGWSAWIVYNSQSPRYLIYDENGEYLGALSELP